jgi:ATP-binding cassette, subfamily C, bacterial LapB
LKEIFLQTNDTQRDDGLAASIEHLARTQGFALDPLRLRAELAASASIESRQERLKRLAHTLGAEQSHVFDAPDPARLPMLCFVEGMGWGTVEQWLPNGQWQVKANGALEIVSIEAMMGSVFSLQFPLQNRGKTEHDTFKAVFRHALKPYRGALFEGIFATAFLGFITLAISLFSMQVYDRVIPTRSQSTLITLGIGVLLAILIELAMKVARSRMMESVTAGVDAQASRDIFQRLMTVRVDALPASVGSLASQLRGFEQVRSFYTASTMFTLVDVPIGLVMLLVVMVIGGPLVASVPLVFGAIALALGWAMRRKVMRLAAEGQLAANRKTGILVEALEGAETIKAGAGGWKFLSRWIDLNTQAMRNELRTRHASDMLGYYSGTLQQISYAGLVAVGAFEVMQGNLTMGSLIACSIMSGRIMAPILGLPGIIVQHAHATAASKGLEQLYSLRVDNHDVQRPLIPARLNGQIRAQNLEFAYQDSPKAISVEKLDIQVGERIGILGPIGSGKSTLLKLLAGIYEPAQGKVLIDGLDLSQISQAVISQHIGYLQQEHRLFEGTLRENLLIGMSDPGDGALQDAMARTGLLALVSNHPKGMDLQIREGGRGLSGGQRQLLAFTRLVLSNPSILLLDEPTANMDDLQERRCLQVLAEMMQSPSENGSRKTCIIVTHKPSLLPLIDRLIVVSGNKLAMDGPRDAVLARLRQNETQLAASRPAAQAVKLSVSGS